MQSGYNNRNIKINMATESLVPGLIIAESVMNSYGAVVAWQDTELSTALISGLAALGIKSVLVYKEDILVENEQVQKDWLIEMKNDVFERKYENDKDHFKELFLNISSGGTLTKDDTDPIIKNILEVKKENSLIVDSIMEIRAFDEYTYYHSLNVAMLAMMIGRWMRLSEPDIHELVRAGLLHDIGKGLVQNSILNKPGSLLPHEMVEMKRHSEYGYQLVKKIREIPDKVAVAVLTHHERDDGSGYPLKLRADKLTGIAKILAIADVFDAMTSNRVYRSHEPVFNVFDLMQNRSFGQLDPIVLEIFLKNITHYYIGKRVRLTNGKIGDIVFMNNHHFSRPVVNLDNEFIDLMLDKTVKIDDLA